MELLEVCPGIDRYEGVIEGEVRNKMIVKGNVCKPSILERRDWWEFIINSEKS